MAGTHGNTDAYLALFQALEEEPYRFGFYEAMRQIECCYADRPRFGRSLRPGDDPIRLGQRPSLRFAPATLASFQHRENAAQLLQVYFFGLFGPNGPLPLHLTEYVRQRKRNAKDPGPADFIDIFHHRLLSLFYRAWADKEPTVQFDRPEADRFGFYLGALCGLAPESMRGRDAMADHAKLHFAAFLGGHTRHAQGLQSILQNYFHIPVKIQEFVGEWLSIPEDSYCYLDESDVTGQLGVSATIGTRSWQCSQKIRICMGPMDLKEYEGLLPSGNKLAALRDIVRNYLGFELNWELNLLLKKEQIPAPRMGGSIRLGWTGWLVDEHRSKDADDLSMQVESFVI